MQRWLIYVAVCLSGVAVMLSIGKGWLPLLLASAGLLGFLFLLKAGRK